MHIYLRLFAAGLLLGLFTTSADADYLEVQRPATIRESPSSDSGILSRPAVGTHLSLLDSGEQTSGYYHAVDPGSQKPGWIYRTLVTVESGDLPPTPANNNLPDNAAPVAPSSDVMRVHYINMKQGNSALLEFSCGAMLIDVGGQSPETTSGLVSYLNGFFARRPDLNRTFAAIIITHTHIDHNLALETIVENFKVSNYIYNGHTKGSGRVGANWMIGHANDDGRHVNIETVTEKTVEQDANGFTDAAVSPLRCSGTNPQFRVLAGPYDRNPGWSVPDYKNENNASLVIRVDYGHSSFLFSGDQQNAAITTMLTRLQGTQLLRADVWEVGHHGSDNGTTAQLLAAVAPKIAIISMGDPNDHGGGLWTAWHYGHPRQSTIDLLNDAIAQTRDPTCVPVATHAKEFVNVVETKAVYATGWDGTIDVTAGPSTDYSVQLEHARPAACGGS